MKKPIITLTEKQLLKTINYLGDLCWRYELHLEIDGDVEEYEQLEKYKKFEALMMKKYRKFKNNN